jgi:SAM-dependent methyltransferase
MNDLLRIKQKWMTAAPHQWWGDSIDVRFYLITQLRKLRNQKVLDVGCNIGMMLAEIDPSNRKYGFDINAEVLKRAQKLNPAASFVQSSLFEVFPYHDASFDIVIMANVMPYHEVLSPSLEEEEQKTRVFQEVYRILKPGGKLLLTTPNGEHFCYRRSRKIQFTELQRVLAHFHAINIYGWNPLPSFVFFLPTRWQKRIPLPYHKYLCIPSPILARIPGMMGVLRYLMTKKCLRRTSKAFYVVCKK